MGHSKLPWRIGHFHDNFVMSSDSLAVCECISVVSNPDEDIANVAFIVTACNEHDTLKAKAELFDEAINALKLITGDIVHEHGVNYGDFIINEILHFGLHSSSLGIVEDVLYSAKKLK